MFFNLSVGVSLRSHIWLFKYFLCNSSGVHIRGLSPSFLQTGHQQHIWGNCGFVFNIITSFASDLEGVRGTRSFMYQYQYASFLCLVSAKYLELRFSRATRLLGMVIFFFNAVRSQWFNLCSALTSAHKTTLVSAETCCCCDFLTLCHSCSTLDL